MGFIYLEDLLFLHHLLLSCLKRMKESSWPLRLSLTLDYSCVIFSLIHTLCGSCIILNDIAFPVWIRGLFFRLLLILSSCVDSRILFLTLDLSSVVVPFYLHFDLFLFLPGPGTAGRNMVATKVPTHTCILSYSYS